MDWQSIETAPRNTTRMYVVRAYNVSFHGVFGYDSDPYCVWHRDSKFVRWPHHFEPTHWMPLPEPPSDR